MVDPNNFDYDESINITKGLKLRDQLNAKVILDLTDQKVIKNGFNSSKDFPSLLSHYQEGYPKYLNPLIAQLYKDQLDEPVDVQDKEKEGSGS